MPLTRFDTAGVSGNELGYTVSVKLWCRRFGQGDTFEFFEINKLAPSWGEDKGYDRLEEEHYPTISVLPTAKGVDSFLFSTFSLKLRNDDDLFSGDSTEAKFYNDAGSAFGMPVSWHGTRVKIALLYNNKGTQTTVPIGVFRIKGDPGVDGSDIAVLQLEDVSAILLKSKASDIRRGDTWPLNSSIPSLFRSTVEETTRGELEIESTYWKDEITITAAAEHFSLQGSVPLRDESGNRVESRDFVPRHHHVDGGNTFYVGYSIDKKAPAVAIWRKGFETWKYLTYESYLDELEFVFCARSISVDSSYFYAFAQGNISVDGEHYNNYLYVYRIPISGLAHGTYIFKQFWPLHSLVHIPRMQPLFQYSYFDNENGGGCNNVSLPIDCAISNPGLDGRGSTANITAGEIVEGASQVRTGVDIRDEYNSTHNLTGFGRIFPKGTAGYTSVHAGSIPTRPYEARSYAHGAAHECFKFDADRAKIYWTKYEAHQWYICQLDMSLPFNSAIVTDRLLDTDSSHAGTTDHFIDRVITAFDVYGASSKLWVAFENHYDVPNRYDPVYSLLYQYAFTDSTSAINSPTDLSPNFQADHIDYQDHTVDSKLRYAPRISTIRHHSDTTWGGKPLMGTVLNRFAPSGHCHGFWTYHGAGDNHGIFASEDGTPYPLSTQPFELSSNSKSDGEDDIFYAQDQATGAVFSVRMYYGMSAAPQFVVLDKGNPVDSENVWSSANIFYEPNTGELTGISASGPPADTQEATRLGSVWFNNYNRQPQFGVHTPGGRISLWLFSTRISDVIPVFDPGEDENSKNALEMLRQVAGGYLIYTDKDGKIVFREIPSSGATRYIRDKNQEAILVGDDIPAERITGTRDTASIVNSFRQTTWVPERRPTNVELVLVPRNTRKRVLSRTPSRSTLPAPISDAGTVQAHQTGDSANRVVLRCIRSGIPHAGTWEAKYSPLLFSWATLFDNVATTLKLQARPDDSSITVHGLYGAPNNDYRIQGKEIRVGDTLFVGDGAIVEIAGIYPDNALIQFVSGDEVGSSTTVKAGTPVTILPRDDRRLSDSMNGVAVVSEDFTLAARQRTLYLESVENIFPGMVLFKDTAYGVVDTVIQESEYEAARVRITGSQLGTGLGQNPSWTTGTVLRAAIWVKVTGQAYSVGNTGVTFSITPRAADIVNNAKFAEGDRIVIDSPGLGLKELKHAIVYAGNSTSIERYQTHEWRPKVKPRLLDATRVEVLLENVDDWAFPKNIGKAIKCPLVPSINIGDAFMVSNPKIYPAAIATYINGYKFFLASRSMELSYRSQEAAERGDEADKPGVDGGTIVGGFKKHHKYKTRRRS